MKTIFLIIATLFFSIEVYSQEVYKLSNPSETTEEESPLDEIVSIINKSLEKAQNNLKGIQIESADLTLKTSYSKQGGGGFKLLLKASKKWEVENANSLTFRFEKVSPATENYEKFRKLDYLTNALIDAAKQWNNLKKTISGLKKKNFSVEVSFTVKKNTEGGIEFEIIGVGVNVEGSLENTAVHTIKLTFV
jgi:hypothetical protein